MPHQLLKWTCHILNLFLVLKNLKTQIWTPISLQCQHPTASKLVSDEITVPKWLENLAAIFNDKKKKNKWFVEPLLTYVCANYVSLWWCCKSHQWDARSLRSRVTYTREENKNTLQKALVWSRPNTLRRLSQKYSYNSIVLERGQLCVPWCEEVLGLL